MPAFRLRSRSIFIFTALALTLGLARPLPAQGPDRAPRQEGTIKATASADLGAVFARPPGSSSFRCGSSTFRSMRPCAWRWCLAKCRRK